jgi:hypothetical protein
MSLPGLLIFALFFPPVGPSGSLNKKASVLSQS